MRKDWAGSIHVYNLLHRCVCLLDYHLWGNWDNSCHKGNKILHLKPPNEGCLCHLIEQLWWLSEHAPHSLLWSGIIYECGSSGVSVSLMGGL